jgi:hypothetical protein
LTLTIANRNLTIKALPDLAKLSLAEFRMPR